MQQVLGNKNDLPEHAKVDELIAALGLAGIANREVSCYSVSGEFTFSPYFLLERAQLTRCSVLQLRARGISI